MLGQNASVWGLLIRVFGLKVCMPDLGALDAMCKICMISGACGGFGLLVLEWGIFKNEMLRNEHSSRLHRSCRVLSRG